MTVPSPPRLLTVRQAAELLALKEGTIRLWIAQRRLPNVSLGRAVRVLFKVVEDFIVRNTIPARRDGDAR